jgi:hypothetical protein
MRVLCALFILPAASAASISAEAASSLISSSRMLENNNNGDYSFLTSYGVKFQGCHHVQQWNDNADEDSDVRIKTKRLARYRLCPSDQCATDKSSGCTSHYGDYVVDLNTFIASYLAAIENEKESICGYAQETCETACGGDNDNCMEACYEENGVAYCNDQDNEDFQVDGYTECTAFDMPANDGNRRLEEAAEEDIQYYIGPYCADQGGEIHLGVFTDDTCTTFAQYGSQMFANAMGFELPYSEYSLVSTSCLGCVDDSDGDGSYEIREQCTDIYSSSGKCETHMDIDYPNESSCSYIEGIKIIREDGVIRTSQTRKSKSAAVAIGVFMTTGVLLGAYVYYLRTKLSRAQINLAAGSQPLT